MAGASSASSTRFHREQRLASPRKGKRTDELLSRIADSATSFALDSRDITTCLPSRDQSSSQMSPDLKNKICFGSPRLRRSHQLAPELHSESGTPTDSSPGFVHHSPQGFGHPGLPRRLDRGDEDSHGETLGEGEAATFVFTPICMLHPCTRIAIKSVSS